MRLIHWSTNRIQRLYYIDLKSIYSTVMFSIFGPCSFWTGVQHQELMWLQIFMTLGTSHWSSQLGCSFSKPWFPNYLLSWESFQRLWTFFAVVQSRRIWRCLQFVCVFMLLMLVARWAGSSVFGFSWCSDSSLPVCLLYLFLNLLCVTFFS